MSEDSRITQLPQDNAPSRRALLLGAIGVAATGASAAVVSGLWTRKDMTARLFNPFTLATFALEPVAGLTRPDGGAVPGFSSADLAGRLSVLNIWASWCPSCREEHALLVDLAARDIAPIYGADVKDEPAHASAFLAEHGNPYTAVGADSQAFLQRALGVRGVPATFVMSPGPKIEVSIFGPLDAQIIADKIIPALRGVG
jgi:cytochrome c biogenesis protein CcmG/thiol:disulfide interchange protein DsbE